MGIYPGDRGIIQPPIEDNQLQLIKCLLDTGGLIALHVLHTQMPFRKRKRENRHLSSNSKTSTLISH